MALVTYYPVLSEHEHEVSLPLDFYAENTASIIVWLDENFGHYDTNGEWDLWEWPGGQAAYFTFRYEQQAMAFKLAWVE